MKQNILLICLIIFIFSACKKHVVKECQAKSFFITSEYNCTSHAKGKMLFIFNLCDSLMKTDTISMKSFHYIPQELEDSYLSFEFPNEYKLKSAERITKFNASIWNYEKDNISQFLKLNGINYEHKRELSFYNPINFKRSIFNLCPQDELSEIEKNYDIFMETDNLIYYPKLLINDHIRNKFKNIEQKDLIDSVKKELINTANFTNQDNSIIEKRNWLSIVEKYKKGDFTNQNDVFEIVNFEVSIKLKLIKEGKIIEKILKYYITIGN